MTTKTKKTYEVIESLITCTEDGLISFTAVYAAESVEGLVIASDS